MITARFLKSGLLFLSLAIGAIFYHTNCSGVKLELVRGGNPKTTPNPETRFAADYVSQKLCSSIKNCPNSKTTFATEDCENVILKDTTIFAKYIFGKSSTIGFEQYTQLNSIEVDLVKVSQCIANISSNQCYNDTMPMLTNADSWLSSSATCRDWIQDPRNKLIESVVRTKIVEMNQKDFNWYQLDNSSKKYLALFSSAKGSLEVIDPLAALAGANNLVLFETLDKIISVGEPQLLNSTITLSGVANYSPLEISDLQWSGTSLTRKKARIYPTNFWDSAHFIRAKNGLYITGWNSTEWSAFNLQENDSYIPLMYQRFPSPMESKNYSSAPRISSSGDDLQVFASGSLFDYKSGAFTTTPYPVSNSMNVIRTSGDRSGNLLMAALDLNQGKLEMKIHPSGQQLSHLIINGTLNTSFEILFDRTGSYFMIVLSDPSWKAFQILKISFTGSLAVTSYVERSTAEPIDFVALDYFNGVSTAAFLNKTSQTLRLLEIR